MLPIALAGCGSGPGGTLEASTRLLCGGSSTELTWRVEPEATGVRLIAPDGTELSTQHAGSLQHVPFPPLGGFPDDAEREYRLEWSGDKHAVARVRLIRSGYATKIDAARCDRASRTVVGWADLGAVADPKARVTDVRQYAATTPLRPQLTVESGTSTANLMGDLPRPLGGVPLAAPWIVSAPLLPNEVCWDDTSAGLAPAPSIFELNFQLSCN
ncbi:hypothetical protein BE08_26650 [Sorangium cellulosum]|uniref:Uncharacterized protein n=1 Tax=Sorangium cellulosum TaxID=56 RepID=A0A150P0P4_SORCE|nr:hypothetical protein BE08_26650 [Sorangium cellulosum]